MDNQNKLYVAVGKEEGEDRKSVLNWALKFWNGETICVFHVHVPTQKTRQQTRYGFRSPLKTVREVEVNQELERLKVKEMLDDSLNMFALKKVPAEKIVIEKESVTDGILELISQLGIQKLVMGAGANSRFLRIKPKPTSEKSNEVLNKAPDFCHIWFQQNIIDNDSYDQLQQPLAQAEKVRQEEACEDSERRQKAESEAMKAIHKLKASDEKLNKMKGKINDLQLKIHKGLKVLYQAAADGEFLSLEIEDEEEEEEKMFFAEILQKKKKLCDKVLMDYDDTLDVYLSADDDSAEVVQVLEEQVSQEPSSSNVPMFSCESSQLDIREATMFFDPSLIIHEGDNGIVYKGCLHNTEVAIKILKPDSVQGNAEFKHEVDVLSKLRHPNLVSLIGACHDSLALIYQYLPNGNLEDRLNCKDSTPPLPWQTRIRIAIELCSVLDFLHSIQPCSIIHSDLKPKNILLDANFSCKLSGFSFCHIISNNKQTLTTDELMGTSYIDPESLDDGLLSLKSDVYCFGIILLRLLTGRPALNIVKEVQHALENDYLHSILDPAAGDWPVVRAQQLAHMALKSCDIKAKDHPNLGSEIWRVLKPVITSTESFSSPMQPVSGDQIPSYFICPIFQDIMRDPHFAADGFTYEADAVRGWFESGRNTSPMTNLRLDNHNLTPNRALRSAIQEWLLQHHLV
uniref:RING-type E3 ubiquitin transferase n=1 Tax=Chenopodium quinoa TaxID=63459 RepID=A0A803MHG0_CHEQI